MILQYCSDLHLEFTQNKLYIEHNPLQPKGDILILAGDIIPFGHIARQKEFFDYVSDNFATTYWIPGNHEYYHFDLSLKSGSFEEKIRSNVFLVNNITVEKEETRLIFSTLWSRISLLNAWRIERSMNDFRVIQHGDHLFNTSDYNKIHDDCLQFLKSELAEKTPKNTIVVTHHVPTLQHYPVEYVGGILNEAFAVDLDNLILDYCPDYWIYGHHHRNVEEFYIGKTLMLTNQLGYVQYEENQGFSNDRCITI